MPLHADIGHMDDASKSDFITVYYFHGTLRCTTCLMIEDLTVWIVREALYWDRIEDGSLRLEILNTDEPDNEHFKQDFDLDGQALVLASYVDGNLVRWKNLERIWELVGSPKEFEKYIQAEVDLFDSFLPETPPGAQTDLH